MPVADGDAIVPISTGLKDSSHCNKLFTGFCTPPKSNPTRLSRSSTSTPFTKPLKLVPVIVPTLIMLLPSASSVVDNVGEVSFDNDESIVMFDPEPAVVVPPVP